MLKARTAVVTGASRGIGRAIALGLARHGVNIAVISSGGGLALDDTVRELQALGVQSHAYTCDVGDFEASREVCARIIADFGGVDILVNNAGITRDNLLLRMPEIDFDAVINTNLKGAFNFSKHLCRSLMKSEAGRIINISSVSGVGGNAGQANYSASKAGLIGLTKALARELAGRDVTCNAIAPGFIATDMTAALPQSALDSVTGAVPLRRMGRPEEVAALAVFLAGDSAAYITGEVIKVDGGMMM